MVKARLARISGEILILAALDAVCGVDCRANGTARQPSDQAILLTVEPVASTAIALETCA